MNQKELEMLLMHELNKVTKDHLTCMEYVVNKTYYKRLIEQLSDLRLKKEHLTLDDVTDAMKLYNISERCYYIAQDILKLDISIKS